MRKDNKGVTIIEIIIVISIISTILMISTFRGISVLNFKERKELLEFKNDICYTRNKAIVESKLYSIDIRPDQNLYIIYSHGRTKKTIKRKEFTKGIKIRYTNIKSDEIVFNYTGAPKGAGAIFLENRKGQEIEITIIPATGKVNIHFDR